MRTEEDGREILLYYLGAGESCIMSILGGIHQETSKVKAIAEEKTEVLFVPVNKMALLLRDIRSGWNIFSGFIMNVSSNCSMW
jgi:CRP/FNR family transcriptional regulator